MVTEPALVVDIVVVLLSTVLVSVVVVDAIPFDTDVVVGALVVVESSEEAELDNVDCDVIPESLVVVIGAPDVVSVLVMAEVV